MKEIGGYLEFEKFNEKPYHEEVIELNTGRNALIYLLKAKKIKKIFIPFFLCSSIKEALIRFGIEYDSYNIDRKFYPKFDKSLENNEMLYIVNYYGFLKDELVIYYKEKYKNIVVDNTQSFFQKPLPGVDTIYTCRKYFGVSDGAYLSTTVRLDEGLEEDVSGSRMGYIFGRFEENAADHYHEFKKNDELLKDLPIMKMSRITRNILGVIDYNRVMSIRNKNFSFLHQTLGDSNKIDIGIPNGPFSYPLYINNGIDIRRNLIRKRLYIPILWPNVLNEQSIGSIEYNYAANILPLPCDQRYGIEDMKIIVREIKECIN